MAHARHAVALPFVPRDKEALMPFLCRKTRQQRPQGAGKVRVDEQDAHASSGIGVLGREGPCVRLSPYYDRPKAGLRYRIAQRDSTGKVWHSIQGRVGSANEKNRLPSCTESAGARQDYASGIGIMCQGPLPAFPVGLGHEAWAFWLGQGSGTNLADCPDYAEGLDSQGPHARDWRKPRPFPLAQCGPQREIPGSRPQMRWTAPGSVCLWVSCWSPGAWPPARSDRRTDGSRRVRFQGSENRC